MMLSEKVPFTLRYPDPGRLWRRRRRVNLRANGLAKPEAPDFSFVVSPSTLLRTESVSNGYRTANRKALNGFFEIVEVRAEKEEG